jgi:uncharacterized membrane protein YjdF
MSTSLALTPARGLKIPSAATLGRLAIGGLAGLVTWEVWARVLTPLVLGGPLEPAGLVISLVGRWTGIALDRLPAEAIHYAIGIVGYPVAYWLVSRMLPRWGLLLDVGVWALFTAFLAIRAIGGGLDGSLIAFWAVVSVVTATRTFNPNALIADCLSWGSFTWFNALGLMAPLAGLPFLLVDWGGGLSFMSYVGHVIYGFVAALVFERLERKASAG